MALSPMVAAALVINEAFPHVSGEMPSAGRRDAGLDLWNLGRSADWLTAHVDAPVLRYLPSRLWLLGLGHLGQAYLWGLGLLPYAAAAEHTGRHPASLANRGATRCPACAAP
jgi:hypothetical protein